MTDTPTPTPHDLTDVYPGMGVTVLGRRAIHSHGSVGGLTIKATICRALGSQADRGMVADVTVSRGFASGSIDYGVTTDDPDALEAAGWTLVAAAQALRTARDD